MKRASSESPEEKVCPVCGDHKMLHSASHGTFWCPVTGYKERDPQGKGMGASTTDDAEDQQRKCWGLVGAVPVLLLVMNFYAFVGASMMYSPGEHEAAVLRAAIYELVLEAPLILLLAWAQRRHQREEEAKEWFYPRRIRILSAAGWALLLAGIAMNLVTALLQEDPGYYTVIGNIPAWLQVAGGIATIWAMSLHAQYV